MLAVSSRAASTVGFIGLGNMGFPMAHNILKAGTGVLCFDANSSNVDRLVLLGAKPATSVEQVATQTNTIFSVLPNDEVVTKVVLGYESKSGSGLLANMAPDALHIGCSTIHPNTSRSLDAKHHEANTKYVAAPIFARPDGMAAMQANFVVSGSDATAIKLASQWLHKCTNGRVAPFSTDDPGAANAVKLCGNFLIASAIESMAEALSLLEANGVDRVQAMQFYSSTFMNSVIHKGYGQRVSERDHRPGGFALELGYKDQRLAHQLAMESQVPMPFLSTLIDRFLSERAKGRNDLDWSKMKLLKKQISEKDGAGSVVLRAEEPEDMWHIYNLIHVSDSVKTTTIRKVVKEGVTGSTSSQRVRMTLQIEGKNIMESQHVRMGAYHTLDLEMNRDFTLTKNCWDVMSLERIEMACDITKQAELAAVVMQVGLAHLCLIKGDMTVIRAKIETSVPKKRPGSSAHAKGTEKFYENIVRSIRQHIDFKLVKCVLLASPGFVKDDFFKFMVEQAVRQDDKLILENKPKFMLCHSSSGHKHALDEVLNDPAIQSQVADTKAVEDVKCLERFFNMLHIDQDRAYYGYKHVVRANANMAIETLMITDALFRSQDIATRRKYVDLVESVRDNGGTVRLFSSLHVSGEKLGQVSGIAAILRFPMPEIDEEDQDDESDSEEEEENEDDSGVGDLSVEALGM
ncbi:MRNA surveillance protein pelota [Phytophthora palmivora]|uniref:Eukaryotic peptide chain release factor subunit 1 n=1 Tax=Phytophthora palmivora TaxID=4796 RepID=A0A2P4XB82_9STRA|nr:MRNA surveillance protein pelota [Phytophthora palmivora]